MGIGQLPGGRRQPPIAHGPPAHPSLHRAGGHTVGPHAPEPPTPTGKARRNERFVFRSVPSAEVVTFRLIPLDPSAAADAQLRRQKQRQVHRPAELWPPPRPVQQEKPQGEHTAGVIMLKEHGEKF